MKTNFSRIYKLLLFILFLFTGSHAHSQVAMRDTTITWNHFEYDFNFATGPNQVTNPTIISETFQGIVIENKYIRLVVIPEYGGRIISYVYKPTGHEQLYQNPVGVPYGFNEGNFYYNFLMVYGGIFPTLTEPEHGKSWFLPWNAEIIMNTPEQVSIKMSWTDDIDVSYHPGQFNNGMTNLSCDVTISVYKDDSSFDYDVDIINNQNQSTNYEYWTCTTLTPGSTPGNTTSPGNSEMIVPTENIQVGWNAGNWIQNSQQNTGNGTYLYDELKLFENWENMGIAYAEDLTADFWGVINHDEEEGIFRIADNETTYGLKFWTWGYQNSISANPNNYSDNARPYIELWGGISQQFFQDAQIAANTTKSWKEKYLPSVGLINVTHSTDDILINFDYQEENDHGTFFASLFSSKPENSYSIKAQIRDELGNIDVIYDETFVHDFNTGKIVRLDAFELGISTGTYTYQLVIKDNQGTDIFNNTQIINVTIGAITALDTQKSGLQFLLRKIDDHEVELEFNESGKYQVVIFNLNGHLLQDKIFEKSTRFLVPNSGVYLLKIHDGQQIHIKKIMVNSN